MQGKIAYSVSTTSQLSSKCERPVLLALRDLLDMQLEYEAWDRDSFLDAAQNARLVASAERYYRAMYYANR